MKHVLIVDDEKPFLLSVRDGLTEYSDKYQVHLAYNGEEALKSLHRLSIDLVVTDLKMPVMDGFQLLVEMSKEFPHLPVIVMTAFGTPDIEARLKKADPFHYLEKPLDLIALSVAIDKGLESAGRSLIRGITLATFLQLVQLENKTCTLKIKTAEGQGELYIQQGELIDAETPGLRGEEAVYQIVCWKDPKIEMEPICLRKEKIITSSVEHMLLEACRMEDEKNQLLAETASVNPVAEDDFLDIFGAINTQLEQSDSAATKEAHDKPRLDLFLNQAAEVHSFVIFDDQGFVQAQHPDAEELVKLAPTIFFSSARHIGLQLDRQLTCLEFRDNDNQRCILCQAGHASVAIRLTSGYQPSSLVSQLATVDFKTAA